MAGWRFRRQEPIDRYIVDFVCFEARLVLEVDGGQHFESEADKERDAHLRSQGFRVLRFWMFCLIKRVFSGPSWKR
ncbi:MAG TPA: endonuclease domain-containing protein [Dongiaceae bacterium]|nr:endonuclease domain-containing protein [Dongiaceae bacterium]